MITRKRLIDLVKVKMEEVTPFDEGLAVLSSDVKPITNYIEENIQPALDELLMICPLHLTTPVTLPTVLSYGRKIGTLVLPDGFLRLHSFKMSNWERVVTRPISIENPQYQDQFVRWGRGGNAKPVIVRNSDKLEIYTFDTDSTPVIAKYVQRVNTTSNIEINQKLVDPLCALIAAKVLRIFGSEQQRVMMQEVDEFIKSEL
ncbi:MAG: hypothetical protein JZU53_06930 [Paludibacter sp.]|nr:hypothetical protein [Paludibacter sp.]